MASLALLCIYVVILTRAYLPEKHLPIVLKAIEAAGMQTGAFSQLTTNYMKNTFNPVVPDDESVRWIRLLCGHIWITWLIRAGTIRTEL